MSLKLLRRADHAHDTKRRFPHRRTTNIEGVSQRTGLRHPPSHCRYSACVFVARFVTHYAVVGPPTTERDRTASPLTPRLIVLLPQDG